MKLTKNSAKIKEYRQKATEIVSKMTLEEKVSQMIHPAKEVARLGIKSYNWWNEALHGVARAGIATIFPQAIGLAASFDEELVEKVGDAVSTEGRAKYNMQVKRNDRDIYKGLTFWAPNVNIFRDPRWGRGHETYGEDPYLTSRLGVAYVNGIQGSDEEHLKAAACAKHFAVHSGPEDLRHEFDAVVSKQDMRETYLPAFKACVTEAKVETVMGAYNRTNGEPCCGSKTLLKDILRDEWGFEGHVVSDCWAIKDFHEGHHVTENPVESVSLAVNNGCDLNCGGLFLYLVQAVKEGRVPESRIDEAVINLFTTRYKLGLADTGEKTVYDDIPYTAVDSDEMRELNRKVSEKCLVLLKNKGGLLPLDKKKVHTIGVIGPNADNRRALVGNYEGTSSRYVTILEGLQDYLGKDTRVLTSVGCHLCKPKVEDLANGVERFSEVEEVCALSDVVVLCLGLDSGLEGEEGDQGNQYASGDKPNLNLPGLQSKVMEIAVASGKPVVLVVLSGSALDLSYAEENVPAIIQGWYPGAQGGAAIARALFGDANPEGKLPVTFYRSTEELPAFTDYSMENRTYRYMKTKALYPFGYGLSYTNFEYSDASISSDTLTDAGIDVTATVKNTGKFDGRETVQVYVKIVPDAQVSHLPNFSLKGIKKVAVKAGASEKVKISLGKEAFELFDENGEPVIHKGKAIVYIGSNAPDARSEELTGSKVKAFEIKLS
ncbi:MAG: glycoside hydrolase family 3 C-terminal domain-containing protein [Lachnospiraceae bacterium]|nr:glycoside hydrolase family 3 C-terminal domain-containing protein [Lachnospiraceae bacterium]